MTSRVYCDLREQLDEYSAGFPATESGVEMKIVKRLFTEKEVDLYLNLSMMLETGESVSQRLGLAPSNIMTLLEQMVDKALIFRLRKGESARYAAVPFLPGSFDFQLKGIDRELAELYDRYLPEGLGKRAVASMPALRAIPVNRTINHMPQRGGHPEPKA
jgi:hypothetical protein